MRNSVINELKINKFWNEITGFKKSYERLQILGVCRTHQDDLYMIFLEREIRRLEGDLSSITGKKELPDKPCTKEPCDCPYRQSYTGNSLQSNAFRLEYGWSIEKWRCGCDLKEGRIGGHPLDYKPCKNQ